MPKKRLTQLGLQNLPVPQRGQADYWDATLPSFGVRVSQGGSKTFYLKVQNSRRAIGRFPLLSLSKARAEAKRILAEKTLGKVRPQWITYPQAVQLFIEDKSRSRRTGTIIEYRRLLNRFPFKSQLSQISHGELLRRLDRMTDVPSERNHAIVALKVFFNWCLKRRYLTENPVFGVSTHSRPSRSRVLSDAELKSIWESSAGTFGTIVKLLILTGQRRGEIAGLRWEWVDEKSHTITLPASVTKNGREHRFPYGNSVREILKGIAATSPLYFPARGRDTPFNGWSKSKAELDTKANIPPWTIHDIRRTFATNLAALGVPIHITERLLNHVSGTTGGIISVYQKHQYLDEMREAIEKWEARLAIILA